MSETYEYVDQWTYRVIRYEFSGFPKDIAQIVAGYLATEQRLRKWINPSELNATALCLNPVAVKLGMVDIIKTMHGNNRNARSNLARNPAAEDDILRYLELFIQEPSIWANPGMLEWLEVNIMVDDYRYCDMLASNPSKLAVDILTTDDSEWRGCFDMTILSQNPAAAEWFRGPGAEHMDKAAICANPNATDIIRGLDKIDWEYLSANSHPWAIEQLKNNPDKINWHNLCRNAHPWAIEQLQHNQSRIRWDALSANPGIFEWLADPAVVAHLVRR